MNKALMTGVLLLSVGLCFGQDDAAPPIASPTAVSPAQNDTTASVITAERSARPTWGIGIELYKLEAVPGMFFLERRWTHQAVALTLDGSWDSYDYRSDSVAGHCDAHQVSIGAMWKLYWLREMIGAYAGIDPAFIYSRSRREERDNASSAASVQYSSTGLGCVASAIIGIETPLRWLSNRIEIGLAGRFYNADLRWVYYDNPTPYQANRLYLNNDFSIRLRTQANARLILKYLF